MMKAIRTPWPGVMWAVVLAILALAGLPVQAEPPASAVEHFESKVAPLLKEHCLKCHGESKNKGGLKLTSRQDILQGGDSGPAIDVQKPEKSLLLKVLHYAGEVQMPPSGKLADDKIAVVTEWLKAGAPWSNKVQLGMKEAAVKIEAQHAGTAVTSEAKKYWAYQPVRRAEVPAQAFAHWGVNPIDHFVAARLAEKGLTPNPPADRLALIRRVTYDLIGLPPTPEEVANFASDKSPQAYEKLVDRLLASPHYGEKWGRHWLDVVRFAETNGYERDGPKPFAWRFRDYVIKSFNDDKPFDQFVREQLAGDEMPGYQPEAVIATGYYRLGLWDDEPADPKQARMDELDDIVATTGQAFLGMTMNCARCHDHKIDPIPQADYYRFAAFFADLSRYSDDRNVRSANNLVDITPPEKRSAYEKEFSERQRQIEILEKRMHRAEEEAIRRMPVEDQRAAEGLDRPLVLKKVPGFLLGDARQDYEKDLKEHEQLRKIPQPKRDLALSVNRCKVNPPPTFVMIRGNAHSPGQRVSPGFPQVLTEQEPQFQPTDREARSSGRRSVLAGWLTAPENPLTARVFVNRLWQHHFGRGLVASPNDFGRFGSAPTHPKLLDWLASEFVHGGWKVKRLHKLMLMSATYQLSSRGSAQALSRDPENELYWRFHPRRLTAEEVRDSVLSVSGRLDLRQYGPSIYPQLPKEVLAGQSMPGNGWPTSPPDQSNRRSIYIHVKRSLQIPLLATHDQADPDSSCPVRYTTTVPTQALGMLNGEFIHEQASALAERLRKQSPDDVAGQVRLAIRLTTGRAPAVGEVEKDLAFTQSLERRHGWNKAKALQHYALLLLNTNEFLYLD